MGATKKIELCENIAEGGLDLSTHSHGLQVIERGVVERSFQAVDLALIGELIDFAAADELLENRCAFGIDDGADYRAVRKIGKLRLDHVARRWTSPPKEHS